MGYFSIISTPFDVLDAAVNEKLNEFFNGYVGFKRETATYGSVVYKLSQYQLGDIGELRIRKLDDSQSELFVKDSPLGSIRKFTEVENNILDKAKNNAEYKRLYVELINKLREEKDELRKKRNEHLHEVANTVLLKIDRDYDELDSLRQSFLAECLDDFSFFIQSEARMSFWQTRAGKRKWIEFPERFAKLLLRTYLAGRYGRTVETFDEVATGAGRIDVYIVSPQGEKAIIELKMCGNRYSSQYAERGLVQLKHYMENKNVDDGYLLVFDSRQLDFSKGFGLIGKGISTKFIDVRSEF